MHAMKNAYSHYDDMLLNSKRNSTEKTEMSTLEADESFLESFNFIGSNLKVSNSTPDIEFEKEIKRSCEHFVTMLKNKAEELKSREKALERAQTLFNERVKLVSERMLQYQKTLYEKYESKCKSLEEKQLKLDRLREELDKRVNIPFPGFKDEGRGAVKKSDEIETIVKLDVGGKGFTTSLNTLCKDQNSMIAIMFSGRHNLFQCEDGSYFIDRDGSHFQYILNYLRGGVLSPGDLPEDQFVLNALRREADFYQIRGFTEIIEECLENTSEKQDFSQEEVMNMLSAITPDDMNISPNETSEHADSISVSRTQAVSQSMTNCKLNFTNKKLNGISFAHTTFFHDVSFRNARLLGASFYGCEFGVGVTINFNFADLTDCDFRQCKGKENGAKMNFAHGGGLLSASSSETFLQMIQEGRISFKRAKVENTLFDPKVADYLKVNRK